MHLGKLIIDYVKMKTLTVYSQICRILFLFQTIWYILVQTNIKQSCVVHTHTHTHTRYT